MAERSYAALSHEYLEEMQELTDAEFGRLCRALLVYSRTGEKVTLSGNERYFLVRIYSQEDRHQVSYKEQKKKYSEAGRKAAEARWNGDMRSDMEACDRINRNVKNANTNTETNTDTEIDTETNISPPIGGDIPPKSPQRGGARAKKPKDVDAFAEFAGDDAELLAAFRGFEEMRKKIKKPLTDKAKERTVNDLQKLSSNREEQIGILNQSEDKCWLGVFNLKEPRYDLQAEKQRKEPPKDDKEILGKILGMSKKEAEP